MTTRDEELDEVERQLKEPYIEKPPQVSITDGSACWIDGNRACGPDCRAYDSGVQPAEGPEVCTALAGLMDVAEGIRNFVSATSVLRKTAQDAVRAGVASAPVPDPTGRKRT